jgi:hypothetical protein
VTVEGVPKESTLNFKVVSHSQKVSFTPLGSYKVANRELAELFVTDGLNRLYEGEVFGSGWPQSPPRDYPRFRVEDNYTAIFDTAAIPTFENL